MDFEGYASIFEAVDLHKDTTRQGCFRKTLSIRGLSSIPMLFMHDRNQVVGRWIEIREDDIGLLVKGVVDPEFLNSHGFRLEEGLSLSIGFKTLQSINLNQVRRLVELDLREISIVTAPCLSMARMFRPQDFQPSLFRPSHPENSQQCRFSGNL